MHRTLDWCPSNTRRRCPESISHTLSVESRDPDTAIGRWLRTLTQRIVALWPSSVCRHLLQREESQNQWPNNMSPRTLFQRSKPERPYHIHHSQPTTFSAPNQRIPNSYFSSSAKATSLSRPTKRPKPPLDSRPTSDSTRPSGG